MNVKLYKYIIGLETIGLINIHCKSKSERSKLQLYIVKRSNEIFVCLGCVLLNQPQFKSIVSIIIVFIGLVNQCGNSP